MSALGAEQHEILASFAEEIRPSLADVASTLQQLSEQPGNSEVAGAAVDDVRTAQAVIGFLELASFQAVLGVVAEALELLGSSTTLHPEQRDAAWQLGELLHLHCGAIAEGDTDASLLTQARNLLQPLVLSSASPWFEPPALHAGAPGLDLDALLDTLGPVSLDPTVSTASDVSARPVESWSTLPAAVDVDDLLATLDDLTAVGAPDGLDDQEDTAPLDPVDLTAIVANSLAEIEPAEIVGDAPAVMASDANDAVGDLVTASASTPEPPAIERGPVHSDAALLLAAIGSARGEAEQGAFDQGTLVDLSWAARTARGAAGRAGESGLVDLFDLIARFADRVGSEAPFSEPAAALFLTTADEVVRLYVGDPSSASAINELVALLVIQLSGLDGDDVGSSTAPAGWGDLPPEILAELNGVEIEDLDEATLARLAGMLDAYDAAAAGMAEAVQPADETHGSFATGSPAFDGLPALDLETDALPSDWALPSELGMAEVAAADLDEDAAFEAEIRGVFLAEAQEHLTTINEALLILDEHPDDPAPLGEIRRAVHTMKGASAAVGMTEVARFCHAWEDALDTGALAATQSLLMECVDALERYLTNPNDPVITSDFADLARRLGSNGEPAAPVVSDAALNGIADLLPTAFELPSFDLPAFGEALTAEPASPPATAAVRDVAINPNDILRVPLPRVDSLVALVGELVVQRSGILDRSDRLSGGVEDVDPILARLRRIASDLDGRFGQAGNLFGPSRADVGRSSAAAEFDALEMDQYGDAYQLSREILELAADLWTTRREIGHLLEDLQDGLVRQGRLVGQLHEQLLDMRLMPIALLNARLQRTVRQAAAATGKEVTLQLDGAQTLVDKTLLEDIADPLLHLLRNAVDHGIESPIQREQSGKAPAGVVRLSVARDGKEIVFRIQDDGAGIDPERVFGRARERGLIGAELPVSAAHAHELIFAPGFSTASSVTELSGRGIGLDVVRTHVSRARGAVTVTSTPGQETTFTIRVPALLVVTPVLVVEVGGRRVALPLTQVRRVLSVGREELTPVGDDMVYTQDGIAMPVRPLGGALGLPAPTTDQWPEDVLLTIVAVGDAQIPLLVDNVLGQHEAVVKTPAPPFDALPALAGATVLGNGDVLLVLNLLELFGEHVAASASRLRALASATETVGALGPTVASGTAAPLTRDPLDRGRPPTILVVDDSLSVRRVVSRTLTQQGWTVQEARDGLQALAMVREARPDAMLLDVEMPRMDGFEVTATLRRDPEFLNLPIVMLTSRGGDKHRRKALDLGVNAYLVKPYQEATLLETLRHVMRPSMQGVA